MHLDGALLRFTPTVSIFYANIFHFLSCINFSGDIRGRNVDSLCSIAGLSNSVACWKIQPIFTEYIVSSRLFPSLIPLTLNRIILQFNEHKNVRSDLLKGPN